MFRHHLKVIYRNILSDKLQSIINIAGLAIGISSFLLILIYVHHELNFDKFHKNRENIYKLTLGKSFNTMAPFAVALKDKVPEIEKIARIDFQMGGGKSPVLIVKKGNETEPFQVNNIIYADSTFFDIFSFSVIQGDAKRSLTEPNSIILTESVALKLFGKDNPVGKNVEFIGTGENPRLNYTVTSIIRDLPENSSLKFNGIVSFNTLKSIKPGGVDVDEDYANWTYDTYVLTKASYSVDLLTRKTNEVWLDDVLKRSNIKPDSEEGKEYIAGFIPLKEVNFFNNNKLKFIWLILSVGLFIIIIAIINFINLSVAKASLRTKEIGIKKAIGSGRIDLVKQFIGETLLLTFLATVLSVIIVEFLMPLFNQVTGISGSLRFILHPAGIVIFISGIIVTGIIAGVYPALYLSSFKPVAILTNENSGGKQNKIIVQILIIFQFILSVILIISTIVISKQVSYMRTENVGFDNKNIITCPITKTIKNKFDLFKQKLLQNPDIVNVAASSGNGLTEGFHISFTNEINGSERTFYAMGVDPDYIKTIGLKIEAGRDFSWDLETDKYKTIILNETAVRNFGIDNPLGFEMELFNYKTRVIGVVKDFHNESFRKNINSLVLWYVPGYAYNLSIRMTGRNSQGTLRFIKKQWEEYSPDIPFEFQFLDLKYKALYEDETKFNLLIGYFSIIAILIACLGLFGLVSFSSERRTKEIGLRKINGASITEVMIMLNRDFVKLVAIAFVIAVPLAYYAMHRWLGNFAYKTGLSWWIFVLAGIIASGIALLTLSWQSRRVATRNPEDTLRYEQTTFIILPLITIARSLKRQYQTVLSMAN